MTYRIPLTIVQTISRRKAIPPRMVANLKATQSINPEFRHLIFDNNDLHACMERETPRIRRAYRKLEKWAFRSELFRIVVGDYG